MIALALALTMTACSGSSDTETKKLTSGQIEAIEALANANPTLQAVRDYGAKPVSRTPGTEGVMGSVLFVKKCATAGQTDCLVSPFNTPAVTVSADLPMREPTKFTFGDLVQVAGVDHDGANSESFSCILAEGQRLTAASIRGLPDLVRAMPVTSPGARKPIVSLGVIWNCDHYKTASSSTTSS